MADDETLAHVLNLYQRSLVAKVQMREYDPSWASGILDGFRQRIEEHRLAEVSYIDQVLERRRRATAELKAVVDKVEADLRRWRR